MKSFFVGLGTGFVLGILFAPRSGDETRQRIQSKARAASDLALEQAERVRRAASDLQDQAGSLGQRAAEEGWKTTYQIKDVAQDVATNAGVGPLAVLNTASREELMNMRGIGPLLADRIVEGRPFMSTQQVVERGILPANLLDELTRELKSA